MALANTDPGATDAAPVAAETPLPPLQVAAMVQGVSASLDRATGDYDSHDLGRVDGPALLALLEAVARLEPLTPADDEDLCPAALHVTRDDDEVMSFTSEGGGMLYACEAAGEVSPPEAARLVAGVANVEAIARRGDEQRREQELRSRGAAGVIPLRFPELPPTNHRTTTAATIDSGPSAPQIVCAVSTGKLFGGKRQLRIGFDWRTNTLWVDREGKPLRFVGDANMIVRFGIHKHVSEIDCVIEDVVVGGEASWTLLAELRVLPGLPPRRIIFEFRKRSEAKAAKAQLEALLATQR